VADSTSVASSSVYSLPWKLIAMNRKLGRDGPQLFPIGLGCMGMSEGYGERAERDEQESIATIHRALDIGANFLDTADIYGPHENERLVGRALQGRRSQAVLATKFGFVAGREQAKKRRIDGRPEYARTSCDASLQRLGVETIDLWYLHRADPLVPIEDTVGAMADCVRAGKVRYLGLSEVSAETLRRAHAVHPISALQSEYSMWTRDPEENGTLETCKELGVTFVAFSPLGRGFLTGTVRSTDALASDDMRRRLPRFQGDNLAQNMRLVDAVTQLASKRGCTPAQLALAWVLGRGEHIVPIPGTKRRSRLEENTAAARITLSADEVRAIDELLPATAIAGARYPDSLMELVNR
jgi:aryl-alcohol dehydrogenase-like predicted oxidoreductase